MSNGRPTPNRVVVKASVEIDVKAWAEKYGVELSDVPDDARSNVMAHLHDAAGPFVSVRVI